MNVAGKTVVVVGGGSGMGHGAARLAAERGAKVAILSFDANTPEIAADLGPNVTGWQLDINDRPRVDHVIGEVQDRFGSIDVNINTAGIIALTEITDSTFMDNLERMIQTNLVSTLHVIQKCIGSMLNNEPGDDGERGVVLVTGSMASFEGVPGQGPYCASKAGLLGVVLPIARELAGRGIRINAIEPGGFATPLTAHLSDEFLAGVSSTIPNPQRLGTPEDYAVFALALVEAKYVNAATMRLDGGWRQTYP